MKKIVIFGTGGAAENLVENSRGIYDIVAFSDNSVDKQGSMFHERPVIPPNAIKNIIFDEIIVASLWYGDIRHHLIHNIGIDEKLIRATPKSFSSNGKKYRPFEDNMTRKFAERLLHHICCFFEKRGIPCYVDHGTLLGLVREDRIMPWDDDIDLSVSYDDRRKLYQSIKELLTTIPDRERIQWHFKIIHNHIDEDVALFITPNDSYKELNSFDIGFSFFRIENGLSVEAINWAPQQHYAGGTWIVTSLGKFRAPNDYEAYLSLHYGQWRIPVKDISFGEINNFKVREASPHWLQWDTSQESLPFSILKITQDKPLHLPQLIILTTLPSFHSDLGSAAADLDTIEKSLKKLAPIFYSDTITISGMDITNEEIAINIICTVAQNGAAAAINIELPAEEKIPVACREALEICGGNVVYCNGNDLFAHVANQSDFVANPLDSIIHPIGESTMGAIKNFRCPHKRKMVLWQNLLAYCPEALKNYLTDSNPILAADVIDLESDPSKLKQNILSMLRARPCVAYRSCSLNTEY